MKQSLLVRLVALLGSAMAASAATLSSSSTAPVLALISQPDFSAAAFNGSQDFTDNAGPPGQTFTAPSAFALASVTVKGFANTSASFGGNVNTGTWTITVSQVGAGGVLTRLSQETANPAAVTDGSAYITLTLATPVPLTSGTQYAFDIFSSTGYFGLAKSTTDVYAGGAAIQHGTILRTAPDGAVISNQQPVDRTFYINSIPEPCSAMLAAAGASGLFLRRRRS